MNHPSTLAKVVTLSSSVLLAGGFILYRTGSLDGLLACPTDARSSSPALKGAAVAEASMVAVAHLPDTPSTKPPTDTTRRRFFGGSKSMPLVDPPEPDTPASEPVEDDRSNLRPMMGGSKSLAPLIEPRTGDDSAAPKQDARKE